MRIAFKKPGGNGVYELHDTEFGKTLIVAEASLGGLWANIIELSIEAKARNLLEAGYLLYPHHPEVGERFCYRSDCDSIFCSELIRTISEVNQWNVRFGISILSIEDFALCFRWNAEKQVWEEI